VRSSPALGDIDGDGDIEVVIGSWDNNVYALNGEDGSLLWSYPTGDGVRSSPALGDIDGDGNLEVVIGSADNSVYALNGEDGSYLWSYPTGSSIFSSPALGDVDEDNNLEVVIGSIDHNVYALNGEDGSLVWSYATNFGIWASPALGDVDGDGHLEVLVGSGTSDNNIYALNGEDGSFLWSYTTGDGVAASPALGDIDGDGNLEVVIGSEDDNVYALSDEPVPPIPFNLISPPDSTFLAMSRPTFIWEPSYDSLSGLRDYEIYINDTLRHTTVDTTWTADFDLGEDHNDWYVVAYDSASNAQQSNQIWTVFIDTTGPLIESTTVWNDTSYAGPFSIHAKVTEISGMDTVMLYFKRMEDSTWFANGMSASGNNWYYGEIPPVTQGNDTVKYYIFARDILQHESTDPTGAPANCYSFLAYSTGVYEFAQTHEPFTFGLKHNPAANRAVFSLTVPEGTQIALFIYDIVGRLIDKLTIGTETAGRHEISWAPQINSGVYFYSLHSPWQQEMGKFVLLK
ncbi:PQQ-like beta-propeller repeat protein, partial [candidate division WOR-3 bacterium]|nr:PQQ-like beta-propeller repeat protein [candidate division WOR-3 bacterium]